MKAATAFFVLLGSCFSLVESKCFLPDGSAATNSQWGVCSEDASNPLSSICCALNRTNVAGGKSSDGLTADTCLPNGLCQNESEDDSGNHHFTYQRAYCTTADWNSGKCLTTCGATGTGFKQMTPCDGTSTSDRWCCGNTKNCCNADNKIDIVTLAAKFGESSSTAKASSTPTSSGSSNTASNTASASTSNASSATSSPTSASEATGLSTGAKAGIGIGAVVGCAALVGVGVWLTLASRRKNGKAGSAETPELDGHYAADAKRPYMIAEGSIHEASHRDTGELSGQTFTRPPGELPGQAIVSELPGDNGVPEKGRHF
ncbi:hypothetical protein P280DRAFT_464988 [Massarina eburnea CBS 473.64]|uniref:Uncharacterized protein n=1 Tax=Massarina eburnea CBS 473.64 TaxID=1395130 RepID=A0A6A6SIJ5_9PLEO|nr:hypothetical protein P280DRAFT_464988 [Massarina eburnea CBS 473.64]